MPKGPTKAELKAAAEAEKRQGAIQALRGLLHHGQTIYTVCRRVPRSRVGGVFAVLVVPSGSQEIRSISHLVADAINFDWDDSGGVWASSAFNIVMELSYALHGHKSKGRSFGSCHGKATPHRFHAGYTFEHKPL